MNDVIWQLLGIVLSAVVSIAAAVLVPLAVKYLNSKIGVTNTSLLLSLAQTAVSMVEQQIGSGAGGEKKGLAVNVLQGLAEYNKLKVTPESMSAAIEAAVLQLKQAQTAAPVNVVNTSAVPAVSAG